MNTQNNRRRRTSVQKLEHAFMELLADRELSGITVTEICRRAGLNRSTFYANFPDVYALADRIGERLEAEVEALYADEIHHSYNSNDFLKLFCHIRDNAVFYSTYFQLGYDARAQVRRYDVRQAALYFDNRHLEYHIAFFQSGFNAIVKRWLAGGCRETPEEMEQILRSEYSGRTGAQGDYPSVQE